MKHSPDITIIPFSIVCQDISRKYAWDASLSHDWGHLTQHWVAEMCSDCSQSPPPREAIH